jgi:hypothetical protein
MKIVPAISDFRLRNSPPDGVYVHRTRSFQGLTLFQTQFTGIVTHICTVLAAASRRRGIDKRPRMALRPFKGHAFSQA